MPGQAPWDMNRGIAGSRSEGSCAESTGRGFGLRQDDTTASRHGPELTCGEGEGALREPGDGADLEKFG